MIARRIAGALLAILCVFAAAVVFTRIALDRIASAEDEVVALDQRKHASQRIASEIRELGLHQVHVLFGARDRKDDELATASSHLAEAVAESLVLASSEDLPRVQQISKLADELQRVYRERGVAAIATGSTEQLRAVVLELSAVVDRVVKLTDEHDRDLDRQSKVAIARAAEVRGQASTAIVVCFAIAFVLASIVGTLLARSIVRPVAALWAGAKRIGAGDLSARIAVVGADELASLARSFNQMTEDLAVKQEALVRTQKLASVGQLAAGVAHEINNPLSVILGYAKLLGKSETTGREELQAIEDEARQCQRIVQELLELARPPQLELGDVELGEVVRSEVAHLGDAELLEDRKVTVRDAGRPVVVVADEGRVRQILANLVVNAAQASPAGGAVEIEIEDRGDRDVAIAIRDGGPGIPPEVLARVFEPFFTTKPRGTGLGLAIAQALADAQGGRITLESEPGRGTCARLYLPGPKETI